MDSTAAPASQNSSHTARPGPPETSMSSKQSRGSHPEPHQRNSQDTSKEAEKNSSGTSQLSANLIDLQKYDNKQRIWIFLYICWLVWNIYASLPGSFQLEQIGSNFIVLVFVAAPYFIQLWAIYKRSLEAQNLGIKVLCVYGLFVAICFVITVVAHFYFAELFSFAEKLLENAPGTESEEEEMNLIELPDREKTKEGLQTSLKDFGISFAYFVVGYFVAKKYRNYLNQREKFIKKNE